REPRDPPSDDLANALRHDELVCSRLTQMAQHLPDEERVALSLRAQRRGQIPCARAWLVTVRGPDERLDPVRVEPPNAQPIDTLLAAQIREHVGQRVRPTELGVAIRGE